jgi:hypothetical protein
MQHALVEREAVDERLQRRSRRALGERSVHLPVDRVVEEVGRADDRANAHVARIDEHRARIDDADAALARDVLRDLPLERLLQLRVDCRRDDVVGACPILCREQHRRRVRRAERKVANAAQVHRQVDESALLRSIRVPLDPLCVQTVARIDERPLLLVAQGPPRRALGNDGERQRLGERELRRRPVEVDQARRADAFDILPVRREIEIRLEDVGLRVARLERERIADLLELRERRARVEPVHQPRELHRHRRAALSRAAGVRADRRADERGAVDARMRREVPVLVQQHRFDQVRRDRRQRRPQPVLLVARRRQAQQLAVGVEHRPRCRERRRQRCARPEANSGERHRRDERNAERREREPVDARVNGPPGRILDARCAGHAMPPLDVPRRNGRDAADLTASPP